MTNELKLIAAAIEYLRPAGVLPLNAASASETMARAAQGRMTTMTTTTYSVNLWGSHPDDDNDDCWVGSDFTTLAEAQAVFNHWRAHFETPHFSVHDAAYVELARGTRGDGMLQVESIEIKPNPDFVPSTDDIDDVWRSELAMQTGMAFGVQGYNDVMGY